MVPSFVILETVLGRVAFVKEYTCVAPDMNLWERYCKLISASYE